MADWWVDPAGSNNLGVPIQFATRALIAFASRMLVLTQSFATHWARLLTVQPLYYVTPTEYMATRSYTFCIFLGPFQTNGTFIR